MGYHYIEDNAKYVDSKQRNMNVIHFLNLKTILIWMTLSPMVSDCLVVTSVLAGDKKFKTVSFDSSLIKPLTFTKELPTTQFRRYRILRPPKFDIDVQIPIKLPLEDEYPAYEEKPKSKPVEKDIYFSTDVDDVEDKYPSGKYKTKYSQGKTAKNGDIQYSSSENKQKSVKAPTQELKIHSDNEQNNIQLAKERIDNFADRNFPQHQNFFVPRNYQYPSAIGRTYNTMPNLYAQQVSQAIPKTSSRSDVATIKSSKQGTGTELEAQQSYQMSYNQAAPSSSNSDQYQQEFVPGGYVNLQLKGPEGGPKMSHADIDRELWAQQLSNTPDALPYPILNYQQLQNFYGGLGTFTNGLNDRYNPDEFGLLNKLKSIFSLTDKFHFLGK